MNRVVITGAGVCLPCGDDVSVAWSSVIEAKSWIRKNDLFDTSRLKCRVCAPVVIGEDISQKYSDIVPYKDKRRMDEAEYLAVIASYNALVDSCLLDREFDKENFGTFISSGVGGIKTMQAGIKSLFAGGKVSPFFLPASLTNMVAGNVALKFGLKGISLAHVSACATSTHSIGEAFNYIRSGRLKGCLAGGTESAICEIGVSAFDSMGALSSNFNDNPSEASRALDQDRDGFVMGDGSVVLVLEELEHAKQRGAKIYCEIAGYGASCDAYHITAPNPTGEGASRSMQNAIIDANISSNDVDYINLHGTSTPLGDVAEITAIKNTFMDNYKKVAISSTKSITGHLLGATGALEAMFCVKAIENQEVPMSANIKNLDKACEGMNIVLKKTKMDINYAMSNSFGFGGTNGTLMFKKYVD